MGFTCGGIFPEMLDKVLGSGCVGKEHTSLAAGEHSSLLLISDVPAVGVLERAYE